MSIYNNILVAIDLRVTHDEYTLSQAVELAKNMNSTLNIIHVMEAIYSYGSVPGQTMVELERKMAEDARAVFNDLTSGYDISADQLIIETGSPKFVITEQAKNLKADLIIVGAHTKHGLQVLLGSTANGVINQAHCDVLVIRTQE